MSCNRTFHIGDTHFGHRMIIDLPCGTRSFITIEEHDRELVTRWNATVRKNDTVWHHGDVYFGGRDAHAILGELNGYKRLILGNHDAYPIEIYQCYFARIYGAAEYRGCILTHIPVHPCQFPRYQFNIHGHMHTKRIDDPRYICVSAEQTDLRPALFDELINRAHT